MAIDKVYILSNLSLLSLLDRYTVITIFPYLEYGDSEVLFVDLECADNKSCFFPACNFFFFCGMLYGLPISSELQIRFFSFIAACVLVGRGIRKGPSKPIIFLKSMHSELELSIISIFYFASWVLSKVQLKSNVGF